MTKFRHVLTLAAACVLPVTLLIPSAARAQTATPITSCGTTITTPGQYVLASNIGPCPADGIDIQTGGVTFDLQGHSITGAGTVAAAGIWVQAETVEGVPLGGDVIESTGALATISGYPRVSSVRGYGIRADMGVGVSDIVTDHDDLGFDFNLDVLTFGSESVCFRCRATNDGVGFQVAKTQLIQVIASNNNGIGVEFTSGCCTGDPSDVSAISKSDVENNGSGITVLGNSTLSVDEINIIGNVVSDNTGNGISLMGGGVMATVLDNIVSHNGGAGISAGTSLGLPLGREIVAGNIAAQNIAVDLSDGNPSCGTDVWVDNTYGTRNQTCIN